MSNLDIEPWEPEETIGKLWHAFASRLDAPDAHPGAAVELAEVSGRLAVFFRGLGGGAAVELRCASDEVSHHRLSLKRRLGTQADRAARASFDGEALRLPASLAVFPTREANAALYLWLTAAAAHASAAPGAHDAQDALRADLGALAGAQRMTRRTLDAAPGLLALHAALSRASLAARPLLAAAAPAPERAIDAAIRALLGDDAPLSAPAAQMFQAIRTGEIDAFAAPRRYRPYRPVPLWPDLRAVSFSAPSEVENPEAERSDAKDADAAEKTHRARRQKSEQAERSDSFILHKFEAILSWAEFLNLNRRVDDDDPDSARKAADDQEEIGLGQISKAPATRLKLHLDLSPEDVDRERISAVQTYPEWDVRSGQYLPDHTRVLTSMAQPNGAVPSFRADAAARRRIRAVRRQFEALRPGRISTPGHLDGDELDIEAAVRSAVDLRACGQANERIWRQSRPETRDLAVSILLDVSRSTESAVGGRAVIDIEREALAALAWGLEACGDDFAIYAFSSLKRHRVYVQGCKEFGQPMNALVEERIGALRPGFYTRLGAAVRHVSADMAGQARKRRLLLVITDGKPNDLDHYEGRHGIEDTRMAIREARRAGQSVFGVTIDKSGKSWFARMFGQGGFAVVSEPAKLTRALPQIYRELVGQ